MTDYVKGTTDNGRTLLRKKGGEEPKSARANWYLWKFANTLNPDEIEFLITKRKQDLKYEYCPSGIRILRTEILLLEDVHRINRRKIREELGLIYK